MGKKKLYVLCGSVLPLMICSGLVYSMFSLYMSEVLGAKKSQREDRPRGRSRVKCLMDCCTCAWRLL